MATGRTQIRGSSLPRFPTFSSPQHGPQWRTRSGCNEDYRASNRFDVSALCDCGRGTEARSASQNPSLFGYKCDPQSCGDEMKNPHIMRTFGSNLVATGLQVVERMARPERFELPTFWF